MRHLLLTTVALLALAPAAHAEAPTEVIVQANRFATARGDKAFSAADLDSRTLRDAPSVDRALKQATQGALFRRSSSLTANPTVQGLGFRAIAPSGAGRALVTLDGIPQNDPFGNWVIWAAIPGDALARAHVVRGAGGGAYASGALTGVVDLDLLPPRSTPSYLRAELGEHGARRLAAGTGLGDLSLHYNDQVMTGDSPIRAPDRGAADIATYGRDRSWLADYQHDVCIGVCGRVDILAGGYDSRRDTGLAGATATATGDMQSLSFTKSPTPDQNGVRLQLWRRASDLANTSVSVAPGRTATTLANNQVATPATGTGFNAALRYQTPAVEWEVGLDGRRLEGRSEEYYRYMNGQPTRFRVAGGTTELIGLYAEATRTSGPWTVTGALRVESWRSLAPNRTETDLNQGTNLPLPRPQGALHTPLTGRFGTLYALENGTILRFAAYNGVRPPSLNELYRPFRVGNDVTEANAALRPETLAGLEFGVVKHGLDIGLFYNELSDPITNVTIGIGPGTFPVAGFIPAGGTLRQRQNGNKIKTLGLEFTAEKPLSDTLSLTTSGTFTHARSGKMRPAQAPDYSLTLGLNADLDPVDLSADMTFDGGAFEDDRNTLKLKPYSRLDLRATYALTPDIALTAQVANALDSDIQIARSGDGLPSYDTGRRVTIGLLYRR